MLNSLAKHIVLLIIKQKMFVIRFDEMIYIALYFILLVHHFAIFKYIFVKGHNVIWHLIIFLHFFLNK